MQSRSIKRHQTTIAKRSRDKGRGVVVSSSKVACCRMESEDDFYEEVSDQEEEAPVIPPVPIVPVVAVAPLNVELSEFPNNPESPSPGPSSPASSGGLSPPASAPGDLPYFMQFHTSDDLAEVEQWVVDARAARNQPEKRVEEPEILHNLKVFLKFTLGPQWELKLLYQSGEVLLDQLRAYLAGYNQLTSFNRRQWLRLFSAWTVQEKREQLELPANAGGFWVL